MNKFEKKKIEEFFEKLKKATEESTKKLDECIHKNCKNIPNKEIINKMKKKYLSGKKKECKPNDFKCGVDYYNDSEYKKVQDLIKECTKNYCLDHSYNILKDSIDFFSEMNKLKIEKFKCLREYLNSKNTSKENIDKYVKKCKLANKAELQHDLKIFNNDIKKIDEKINQLEKGIKSRNKEKKQLEKKIKNYKPKKPQKYTHKLKDKKEKKSKKSRKLVL